MGGAEIAPVLLTRLVNDVGDDPDQLSILQHALNRTWASWQNEGGGKGPLDLTHYEAIGTMAQALDQHAERAYAELGSARQQQICERLFKALTDKATDARGVRRPTTLGTLCALVDATAAEITDVIDVFRKPSRSFLMPPAGDAIEAETVIDISHESLMRVWERLTSGRMRKRSRRGPTAAWPIRQPCMRRATRACGATRNCNWRSIGARSANPTRLGPRSTIPDLRRPCGFLTESSAAREAERAERQQRRQRELKASGEGRRSGQLRTAHALGRRVLPRSRRGRRGPWCDGLGCFHNRQAENSGSH